MATRIVIQDRITKKTKTYDTSKINQLQEANFSFDPKNQIRFYEAYVNKVSSLYPHIRFQKKRKCKSLKEAIRVEKKLIQDISNKICHEESKGSQWLQLINFWELEATKDYQTSKRCINPLTGKPMSLKTVLNNVNLLKTYTKEWLQTPASEITRFHGKQVLKVAEESFKSYGSVKRLKAAIQSVYNFGIEEGIIIGVRKTPVCNLIIDKKYEEKLPEILTVDQVKKLLKAAELRKHPWFPIWAIALATGMRSSELYALRKENVLLGKGIIRICESWDWQEDQAKSTKAGYWRNAPIAKAISPIINSLMTDSNTEFLFPRFPEWKRSEQAKVLRQFCKQIRIPSIRFHTLRACFATHLLASGTDQATVMRIGGWRTFKTFEIYVRLAGVKEMGATDDMMDNFFAKDSFQNVHYL